MVLVKENWREQFETLLDGLTRWLDTPAWKTVSEEGDLPDGGRHTVEIFTATHAYRIAASPNYLGCTSSARMPLPGEDWTRGNDLADGDFSLETWAKIMTDIVGYELKAIAPEIEHMEVPEMAVVLSDECGCGGNCKCAAA